MSTPAGPPIRQVVTAQEIINYSEFWALSGCEQRWVYGYLRSLEEQGERRGLNLGTLLHLGGDLWNRGQYADGAWLPKEWTDDINTGGKPGEPHTRYLHEYDPAVIDDAIWLLSRYVEHYGPLPPSSWRVIDSERWLVTALDELKLLVGRTDGVLRIEGDREIPDGLWLLERKSYGSKGRLDYVHVDPQLVVYKRLVEAEYGEPLMGVLYDGFYTYHWKPEKPTQGALIAAEIERNPGFTAEYVTKREQTEWAREAVANHPGVERPAAESFERRYVDISPEMVEVGERFLYAAIRRRQVLRLDPKQAMPNVGQLCNSCGFKSQCWADLRGEEPQDIEIEIDDPEAEPV